jgi:predicted ATPase with chaperone activity
VASGLLYVSARTATLPAAENTREQESQTIMFRTRILATVFAAFTLVAAAAPAYAGEKHDRPTRQDAEKATKFQEKVSERIEKALEAAVEKVKADDSLTVARKAAIISHMRVEAKEVKVAAAEAAKDGKVTKAEAKRVRELARVDAKKIRDMIPGPKMLPKANGPGHDRPHRPTPVRPAR